eukprot:5422763-Alexandrium_andersonii.AAC.2
MCSLFCLSEAGGGVCCHSLCPAPLVGRVPVCRPPHGSETSLADADRSFSLFARSVRGARCHSLRPAPLVGGNAGVSPPSPDCNETGCPTPTARFCFARKR